jgi:pimeloyl-ACP methyl ester carboxylesterase
MTGARSGRTPGTTAIAVDGGRLHCVERGEGDAVVFVHMGGRDYRYWDGQLPHFAEAGYRAVAYSRRFAFPNANPMRADYSPRLDAADLAAVIEALDQGPTHVVASSIGACAALLLVAERSDLVRTLTIAEPPVLPWAARVPGGAELVTAFMRDVWHPAADAFRHRADAVAMRVLMDYFVGPGALARFPEALRTRVMRNARDWAAQTASADPFPAPDPDALRALRLPVLLLSGGATLPMHRLVDAELELLLAEGRRVVMAGASHDVWGDAADACRAETLALLAGGAVSPAS